MKRPLALLVNDDGVHSIGIHSLKEEIQKDFECIVIGPKRERSGIGKALTVGDIIRIEKVVLKCGEAYSIDGTPADAILIALHKILSRKPDIVIAGINLGPNLGVDDILNSGTLGAAMEAAIHGIPSLAISYCVSRDFDDNINEMLLEDAGLKLAAKIARSLANIIVRRGMPEEVDILSVNVPDYRRGIKGVKITRPSKKGYPDIHIKSPEGYRIAKWDITLYPKDSPDTDVEAVRSGYISISPISLSLTSPIKNSNLRLYLEVVEPLLKDMQQLQ
ncbi:MAG: 5'/3'-nucleotidase SurE [Thermoprotei archaeon]|nr:MAG: 5'/3'-nucleotidase SurE [Thermoprotei archaeon]